MQLKLRFLAFGLVVLFGSLLASSQHISVYASTDRLSAASATGASMRAANNNHPDGASAVPRSSAAFSVYLPVAMSNYAQGIYGYLRQGGAPIGGISLELRFYNGSSYTAAATTTTNSDGFYLFTGMPALAAGQFYYVRYLNHEQYVNRLWFWGSRNVTLYAPGYSAFLGTSDLANIALVSPSAGATVTLPYPFQWTRRSATPTDSYYLGLFQLNSSLSVKSILFGYVSTFNMPCLPPGFAANVPYYWNMNVQDENLGQGTSYWSYKVTFTNTGACAAGALDMMPQTTGRRDDIPLPPQRGQ